MKTKLGMLAVALIAGGTMFAQPRVSIGIGVGGYGPGAYPPPAYAQYMPPCPGPGYAWIDGHWRRPYAVAPRYVEPRVYNSYRGHDREEDRHRGEDRHDDRGRGYANGFRR